MGYLSFYKANITSKTCANGRWQNKKSATLCTYRKDPTKDIKKQNITNNK